MNNRASMHACNTTACGIPLLPSLCVCVCVHHQATSSSSSRGPHTTHCVVPTQEFTSRARCTALLNLCMGETEFESVSCTTCMHARTHSLVQPLHCMAAHLRRVAAPCDSRHCRCLLEKTLTSHGSFLSAHRAPGNRRSRSMSHRLMLLQGACVHAPPMQSANVVCMCMNDLATGLHNHLCQARHFACSL
jgi:hypothetical protein